uniref:Microsomal glutathione S-transferase 1 n=1 Tax=Ciona savignyi TaxID=51511 RepID=H2Y964_CIOSA
MEISLKNELIANLAWYTTIVVLKMMLMSTLTSVYRLRTSAFANEEDARTFGSTTKGKPFVYTNAAVERVRRCHLNDIENIIPFVIIGFLYVLTEPAIDTAIFHFQLFAGCRIAHMFCYLISIPQPSRFVFYAAGYFATLSMAFRILTALY